MEKTPALAATSGLIEVNNGFYDGLGDRWYEAWDDPVALLRAEGRLKNPWVAHRLRRYATDPGRKRGLPCRLLDVGCGAGFLANGLALEGHAVHGVDMSLGSLKVAKARDVTGRSVYGMADAYRLPYGDAAFDAVSALDFLEHVDRPADAIAEMSRVLKPGGLFFFHTFNRNPAAYLAVIKGLEWFVRNTPEHMHILSLFIKPVELKAYCRRAAMEPVEMVGMRPEVGRWAFWKMLLTGKVPQDFTFRFTPSLALSYLGMAVKRPLVRGAEAP